MRLVILAHKEAGRCEVPLVIQGRSNTARTQTVVIARRPSVNVPIDDGLFAPTLRGPIPGRFDAAGCLARLRAEIDASRRSNQISISCTFRIHFANR